MDIKKQILAFLMILLFISQVKADDELEKLFEDIKCYEIVPVYDKGAYQNGLRHLDSKISSFKQECQSDKKSCVKLFDAFYHYTNFKEQDLEFIKKHCDDGIYRACSFLGDFYLNGYILKKSFKKALSIYENSCDKDDSYACYVLADMYAKGIHFKQDFKKADELYIKACVLKYPKNYILQDRCKEDITRKYYDRPEIIEFYEPADKLYKKANEVYTRGCEKGLYNNCHYLGNSYEYAKGVKKDYQKAKELHLKACKLGNADACLRMGMFYRYGIAVKKDYQKAKDFFKLACAKCRFDYSAKVLSPCSHPTSCSCACSYIRSFNFENGCFYGNKDI